MSNSFRSLWNQILALIANVNFWFKSLFSSQSSRNQPICGESCIKIDSPGGVQQLKLTPLDNIATVGYNIPQLPPPFATLPNDLNSLPSDLVLVKIHYFSVNYADIVMRWGLYESALQYVGWPIVPGFDFQFYQ